MNTGTDNKEVQDVTQNSNSLSKREFLIFLLMLFLPSVITHARPLGTFSGTIFVYAPMWYFFTAYNYDLAGNLIILSQAFFPLLTPHILGGWLEPIGPMFLLLGLGLIWSLWRFRVKGTGTRLVELMLILNFIPLISIVLCGAIPVPLLPIIGLYIFRVWKNPLRMQQK